MNLKIISLLFLSSVVIQTNTYAGVYKCLKENNEVYYKDKPCASGQKEQKVTIRKKTEKHVESASTQHSYHSDDPIIQKLETHRRRKEAEFEEIKPMKDVLRVVELEENNRIRGIDLRNKMTAVHKSEAKQRKKQYANYMESKERSGAVMTEEEKNWRSWDQDKFNEGVNQYQGEEFRTAKDFARESAAENAASIRQIRQMRRDH